MAKPFGITHLFALPAPDLWHASTAATMYAVEPRSIATVRADASGLKPGEIAGLVLFSGLQAWLGVECAGTGLTLVQFDEQSGRRSRVPLDGPRVWLRAECDFLRNEVGFRYSIDGWTFRPIGEPHVIGGNPGSTRGIQCSLFSCGTTAHTEGGRAEFDSFVVDTQRPARPDARQGAARPTPQRGRSSPAAPARDR